MRKRPLTILAAGVVAAAIATIAPAAVGAANPGPATQQQLCDAQIWPRPIPDVVGLLVDSYGKQIVTGGEGGALACWDNVHSVTKDGEDLSQKPLGPQQITAMSPAPGTPVGRHEPVTLQVTRIDYSAPPAFRPCDWVTSSEASGFIGVPDVITESSGDRAGSVDISCGYRNPHYLHNVTSELMLPGAFPVDAASTYALGADENGTAVGGLGLAAECHTNPHGSQDRPYTVLTVLLEGNRMYTATGWGNEPCDVLKQFAHTAIGRL